MYHASGEGQTAILLQDMVLTSGGHGVGSIRELIILVLTSVSSQFPIMLSVSSLDP